MQRCDHRHARMSTPAHRINLLVVAKFIEHHHLWCQTTHRLQNADRFRITTQHIASTKPFNSTEFTTFIHHSYTRSARGERSGNIPQQACLSARWLTHQQGRVHAPSRTDNRH